MSQYRVHAWVILFQVKGLSKHKNNKTTMFACECSSYKSLEQKHLSFKIGITGIPRIIYLHKLFHVYMSIKLQSPRQMTRTKLMPMTEYREYISSSILHYLVRWFLLHNLALEDPPLPSALPNTHSKDKMNWSYDCMICIGTYSAWDSKVIVWTNL